MINKLNIDYDSHPAFSKLVKSLDIELDNVYLFDQLFNKFTELKGSSKNASNQLILIKVNLSSIVNKVFSELKAQVNDNYELEFLSDLETYCIELLRELLDYYPSQKNNNAYKNSLSEERFLITHIDSGTIELIIKTVDNRLRTLKSNALIGPNTRENLSINNGNEIKKVIKILNNSFKKNGVLASVSQYMGSNYAVGGLALELSDDKSTWWKHHYNEIVAPETIYAHLDESIKFPKAIVYLTDVDSDNGPTSCYPGVYEKLNLNALQNIIGRVIGKVGTNNPYLKSYYNYKYHQPMSCNKFRKHFMLLPKELRFNSHYGWDICKDSTNELAFLKQEKEILGNSGTTLVFDGSQLFHRGGLIKSGQRVVLQVIFSPHIPLLHKVIRKLKRLILERK